ILRRNIPVALREAATQLGLEDLAGGVLWQAVQYEHGFWTFIAGELGAGAADDVLGDSGAARARHDRCNHPLHPARVRNAEHHRLEDAGIAVKDFLDLTGID